MGLVIVALLVVALVWALLAAEVRDLPPVA